MTPFHKTTAARLAILSTLLALAGCGGGGGGGAPAAQPQPQPQPPPQPQEPPPPPPPTAPPDDAPEPRFPETTAEEFRDHVGFRRQHELVRAGAAYENHLDARGDQVLPGEGATIGVLDGGFIGYMHPLFDPDRTGWADGPTGYPGSHGTSVASVAVAGRDAVHEMHGIAWGANVELFELDAGVLFPEQASSFRRVFTDGSRIDFLNLSIGELSTYVTCDGVVRDTDLFTTWTRGCVEERYGDIIEILEQEERTEKTILVWAAGNTNGLLCRAGPSCYHPSETDEEGNPRLCTLEEPCFFPFGIFDAHSPDVVSGWMELIPELQGHSVAVVSVDLDGEISDFSNRCGEASERCIAAPGEGVYAAEVDAEDEPPAYSVGTVTGTSFSAPIVAGSLAVMKSAFEGQMSNEELLQRLFDTANKEGRYANEALYGQGLVDLGAATRPFGGMNFVGGAHATSGGIAVHETWVSLGPAFGDGLAKALGSRRLTAFDSLGAPFPVNAASLVSGASRAQAPAARLRRVLRPPGHARAQKALVHASGFRRAKLFERSGWSTSLLADGERVSGAALERPGLALTAFHEKESLYGTRAEGAFGRVSGSSLSAGSARRWTRGAWTLGLSGEAGVADPKWRGVFGEGASTVWTSAFAAEASRRLGERSQAGFSLSQPLRVERAAVDLDLPIRREAGTGRVVRERRRFDLEPSGRQLDLGASFARRIGGGGSLVRLELVRSRSPGHVRAAKAAWQAAAGLRLRW